MLQLTTCMLQELQAFVLPYEVLYICEKFVMMMVLLNVSFVTQEKTRKLPSHYQLAAQRKGFRRYMTDDLRDLLQRRGKCLEEKEAAMAGILQVRPAICKAEPRSPWQKYNVNPQHWLRHSPAKMRISQQEDSS